MNSRLQHNQEFLRNLYSRGPFERHAIVLLAPPLRPIWEAGDYTESDRPVRDWLPWAIEPYLRWQELAEQLQDDGVPVVPLMTGTHIYAAAFGCPTHYYPDNNPAAQPIVFSAEEADRLAEPAVENCRNLMRILELAALVREELGPDVIIGPPDLQSGFDTACLIWDKTDLFCALYENPGAVQRLARKCANLLRNFLRLFYREFPTASLAHCPLTWVPPELGPWISNDECGLISVEMFEEFLLPELIELAETFGGLGMHCCADADHQFPSFKKIPNFYAFNRGRTKSQGYEAMLQILGGPEGPVFVPGGLLEEEIRQLLLQAPPGSRFIFHCPYQEPEQARRWLDNVRTLVLEQ